MAQPNRPTEGIDLPPKGSKRPPRIVSPEGAAALLSALTPEERPTWATVFCAGLRRGELQALRCMDVDLRADLIHARLLTPGPGGPLGFVYRIAKGQDGRLYLDHLAFGVRHLPPGVRGETVYRRAHRRLHG